MLPGSLALTPDDGQQLHGAAEDWLLHVTFLFQRLNRCHCLGSIGRGVDLPAARSRNAPWWSMDPCQKGRLNSASDWAASAWFTKGCCRVGDSRALQLGSPGFSSAKSVTSGYSSETVRRRSADGLLRPFNGWPRTNWPESASLPISSHNRTKLFLPVTRL